MANLYSLTSDFLKVQELMEEGELDKETLETTLECIDFEIEDKAEAYAKIIKNLTSDIDGLKEEEKRLASRRKIIENNISRLKENLEQAMKVTGKTKFKTQLFSFNIQKNPPTVFIKDETLVPEEFYVPQPSIINKAAIKELLKNGEELAFAELIQGESLRIK